MLKKIKHEAATSDDVHTTERAVASAAAQMNRSVDTEGPPADLTGRSAERVRKWDSCFTMDFSYIHGGSVRSSVQARYRQWLTHKFASWKKQFGTFGCVGCGRCITWCPVGIDVTEEIGVIRESERTQPGKSRAGSVLPRARTDHHRHARRR